MPTPKARKNQLIKRVDALSKALAGLGKEGPGGTTWEEFIRAIRDKYWTTPAEFLFASTLVDSMLESARSMTKSKAALIRGSKSIVAAGRKGQR
jgi:hypothetical protein